MLVDIGSWFSSCTPSSSKQNRPSMSSHNNNQHSIYPTNIGKFLPTYVKGLFTTKSLTHSVKNHHNPPLYRFIADNRKTRKNKK